MKFKHVSTILLLFLIFSVLVAYAVELQIINSVSYKDQADALFTNTSYTQPLRGRFIDTNGVILARSKPLYKVRVNPKLVNLDKLAMIPSTGSLITEITQSLENSRSEVTIEISESLAEVLSEEAGPGIVVFEAYEREYVYPRLYSNIIGYVGAIDSATLEDEYYASTDTVGKNLLEKTLEEELRGIKNKKLTLQGTEVFSPGSRGNDVVLTIDTQWQESVYNILSHHEDLHGAVSSAGVILDTNDGSVAALVSTPGFDTNKIIHGDEDYIANLASDFRDPFLNKATGQTAPPGSTFKVISSYNLLDQNTISPDSTHFSNRCTSLGGFEFCEYGKNFYGTVNVSRALVLSSNLFYCNYGQELASTNPDSFSEVQRQFGLGTQTGIDIPGEVPGNIDGPNSQGSWYAGEICNAYIGQGSLATTPIQMAQVAAAIRNDGNAYAPHVVERIVHSDGKIISEISTEKTISVDMADPKYQSIKEGMQGVISSQESVLYWQFVDLQTFNIHAKTGTAEATVTIDGRTRETVHGWIIGSFEYEGNTYAFAFHLHHGGGGYYTSFVLKDFLQCLQSNFTDTVACRNETNTD